MKRFAVSVAFGLMLVVGASQYIDGNTLSVTIKACSGTNDAIVNFGGSGRTFTLVLPLPIPGSLVDPAAPSDAAERAEP